MDETLEKEFPWGIVVVAAIIVAIVAGAAWIVHDKNRSKEREAMAQALDKELVVEEQAVKDERHKLEGLTRNLEEFRVQIQTGQIQNAKAAVDEFNKKAAEQRAEREKFVQMADQYNQKVAQFKQLEQ